MKRIYRAEVYRLQGFGRPCHTDHSAEELSARAALMTAITALLPAAAYRVCG